MKKYAFIHANILDGTKEMHVQEDMVVLVEGKLITRIGKDLDTNGYEVINLNGKYLLPGLINMHVHLPATGKPKKKQPDQKKLVKLITSNALLRNIGVKICASSAKTELYGGCTTIRTVGGVDDFDTILKQQIIEGKAVGPRILASNSAISVEGGHMAGTVAYTAKNLDDVELYTNQIIHSKADLVKLMITGGVLDATKKGEPGAMKMPLDFIRRACDIAHEHQLKVAAHVESSEGVKAALQNGVDTIEHGAVLDDEMITLFKENQASFIATISPALPFALFSDDIMPLDEVARFNGQMVFNGGIECVKTCLENNIPVGLGTDTGCPYVTHYDMWRELVYFVKYCHVTPAFALHTATLNNAKIAGIDKETGSIQEGKCADMIVCANNPLEDLTQLRHLDMVMMQGKPYTPKLKKYDNVERILDQYL